MIDGCFGWPVAFPGQTAKSIGMDIFTIDLPGIHQPLHLGPSVYMNTEMMRGEHNEVPVCYTLSIHGLHVSPPRRASTSSATMVFKAVGRSVGGWVGTLGGRWKTAKLKSWESMRNISCEPGFQVFTHPVGLLKRRHMLSSSLNVGAA